MKSATRTVTPINFSGLRRYLQVIFALLRKEELSRRQAPMESIVNLLEPVFILVTMAGIGWFLGTKHFPGYGGNPALFYATGFFAMYFFIYISRRMRRIDRPTRRFPIEKRIDHILVHILLRVADYAILGVIVFGLLYLFVTPDAIPHNFIPVFQAFIAIVMLGFGWGVLHIVLSRIIPLWQKVAGPLNRSFLFVSGVLFIPDFLSPATRYLISFNPMMHVVTLFRSGFYPHYPSNLLDTRYLAWACIIAVAAGLVLERVSRRLEYS